jgi:tetratricopeptide (TPR) repeat protein/cellulose biosynthesis protein BcsQ
MAMTTSRDERDAGRIITFYSYKGGTGRSMALANIAFLLCEDGSKRGQLTPSGPVLAIDWDLEAPGLHRYFAALRPDRSAPLGAGLIELFTELEERASKWKPTLLDSSDDALADELVGDLDLGPYLKDTVVPGLRFIPAGCMDANYAKRVTGFDWQVLHRRLPTLIAAFSRRLAEEHTYVLIDSRTGISDTSGICTMLMPDLLVAVFTPNLQSISGLLGVVREATAFRRQSSDLRPLTVFPLPSRIESARPSLLELWRSGDLDGFRGYQPEFERLLGSVYGLSECDLTSYFDEVQIQHVPDYAYGEELAAFVEDTDSRLSLRRSYENFTSWLVDTGAPWLDPQTVESERRIRRLSEQAVSALDQQRLDEARALLARAADEPRTARSNVAPTLCQALSRLGDMLAEASLLTASEEAFRQAAELAVEGAGTDGADALEVASYLERRADLLTALGRLSEARTVLREVVTRREDVLGRTHVSVAEAYEKLGTALGALGEFNAGVDALQQGLEIRVSAVGEEDPSVANSLERLAETLARTGAIRDSERYLQAALKVIPATWQKERGRLYSRLAMLRLEASDLEGAQMYFEWSIECLLSGNTQSAASVADSYDGLGHVALTRGDFATARDHYEHAQVLREEALGPHHPATLRTPLNLGDLARAEGDLNRAERQYSRVVSQSQRAEENDPLAVEALHRLARAAASRGDFEKAHSTFEQALSINKRLGNQAAVAGDYHQLGMLAYEQGDHDTAEQRFLQSLEINERLGNQSAAACDHHELGIVARERGDYYSSEQHFTQSLDINERLGNQAAVASDYSQLGALAEVRRHPESAEQRYLQALEIDQRLGNECAEADGYHRLGKIARWRGDYGDAEQRLLHSVEISERLGDESAVADVAQELGAVARERGDYDGAEEKLRRSVEISKRLGDDAAAAFGYQQLAILAELRQDWDGAERCYLQSVDIDQRLGNKARVANTYASLAALVARRGPDVRAVEYELQALSMWIELASPQALASLERLDSLRSRLGDEAFAAIAGRQSADARLRNVIKLLRDKETRKGIAAETEHGAS